MVLRFPPHFLWGTSTSAAQIETAFDHQWKGCRARDGYALDRTTDHEQRRGEDLELIRQFGTVYRCSVDWSRLQREPFAPFDEDTTAEYQDFFEQLNANGVRILFVLHHFAHPRWFEEAGGWLKEDNVSAFVDFVVRCIEHFGAYIFNWNTFNEPNVYALNAFILGEFPPRRKKRLGLANRALRNMGRAHDVAYDLIKRRHPDHEVSISLNTASFVAASPLGAIPAIFTDWWFHRRAARPFRKVDYWGLSYYAHVPFAPFPVTEINNPGRLDRMNVPHDRMWGYRPEGLGKMLRRFRKRYRRPLFLVENGICTDDPQRRIESIKAYLQECHAAIEDGVDLRGYLHWSTWDNFEWRLGPTYRFGLVRVNLHTKERTMTSAGLFYAQVCQDNAVDV